MSRNGSAHFGGTIWDRPADETWKKQARCATEPVVPNFFEHRAGRPSGPSEAELFCQGCPVRRQCLKYAVDIGAEYGVWGGVPAAERLRTKDTSAA